MIPELLIMFGRYMENNREMESYQLLMNERYYSVRHDPKCHSPQNGMSRASYFEIMCEQFVEIIQTAGTSDFHRITTLNGIRINKKTSQSERILPLDELIVEEFIKALRLETKGKLRLETDESRRVVSAGTFPVGFIRPEYN